MKNRITLLILLALSFTAGFSQNGQLIIDGTNGKFYLNHIVVAKENWYSIGRLFNFPPHDIASFNNIPFDKPLEVNTPLKIPLTSANFDQKQLKSPGESLIPIYHVLQEKEWMYKISSIYNDVPVTSLEKWNKIKRDDVRQGTPLIVGFLKVKTDLSPLASGISSNPVSGTSASDALVKPVKSADLPAQTTAIQSPSNSALPSSNSVRPASVNSAANPGTGTTNAIAISNPPERVNNYAASHSNGGFFSIDYSGTGKTSAGQAGTFKSTSGWSDGKYYALMNGIPVGSIIRVSGANGKTIYAKVLGQLPEMKESAGLLIRISNAASAELGLGEGKFPVDVRY
jgi:hypothetical protein